MRDVQRIAALPAEQQVEEVRKELIRRNPGFDGKMETKIEGGVVTEIHVVTDEVTDISPLRVFNALRVLDCSGTHTADWRGNGQLADLNPLKGVNFSHLIDLNFSWTKLDDAGLAHFKDCKDLTGLELRNTRVTDAGLAHFKDCRNLTYLDLHRTHVSNAGLAHFKGCKDLTYLSLPATGVSDAGLALFKECKSLTTLDLSDTPVSDAGLAAFKDCKNLKMVLLGWATEVTDAGLASLKDCKKLMTLDLRSTKVTDLSLLRGMPLKKLWCDFQPERRRRDSPLHQDAGDDQQQAGRGVLGERRAEVTTGRRRLILRPAPLSPSSAVYANSFVTTSPDTSVSRKSRPWNRNVSFLWSSPRQVQNRRLQIMDVNPILHGGEAQLVGDSEVEARFDAAARHPHRISVDVMIAAHAVAHLAHWRPSEFAAPYHQCGVQ